MLQYRDLGFRDGRSVGEAAEAVAVLRERGDGLVVFPVAPGAGPAVVSAEHGEGVASGALPCGGGGQVVASVERACRARTR